MTTTRQDKHETMPGPNRPRMAELDGLRAIAILLVLAFHSWFFLQFAMETKAAFLAYSDSLPWLMGFIRRGDIGVDIFFVLSGYLLSWQLFRERQKTGRINFKKFYLHRVFRIYPLYVFALALVTLGAGFSWGLLGNLLAYNIWSNPYEIIIPWSWSLSVELEFYAIVPLLVLLVRNGRSAALLALGFCALAVGWSLWTLTSYPQLAENSLIDLEIADRRADLILYYRNLYVAMPVRISQFGLGLAAAWVVVHKSDFFKSLGRAHVGLLVAGVIATAAVPLLYNPHGHLADEQKAAQFFELLFGRVSFAFATALLISMLHLNLLPRLKVTLASKVLEPIARFSFSMYLFHPLFVYVGIATFVGKDKVTSVSSAQYLGVFAVTLIGSVALGFISWHALENRAIRLGRKLTQDK